MCMDLAADKGLILALRLGIQIVWSHAGVGTGVIAYIAQLYYILLSTLFSINRQLSLLDRNHALIITSSPLTIHLASASVCDLITSLGPCFSLFGSGRDLPSGYRAEGSKIVNNVAMLPLHLWTLRFPLTLSGFPLECIEGGPWIIFLPL